MKHTNAKRSRWSRGPCIQYSLKNHRRLRKIFAVQVATSCSADSLHGPHHSEWPSFTRGHLRRPFSGDAYLRGKGFLSVAGCSGRLRRSEVQANVRPTIPESFRTEHDCLSTSTGPASFAIENQPHFHKIPLWSVHYSLSSVFSL